MDKKLGQNLKLRGNAWTILSLALALTPFIFVYFKIMNSSSDAPLSGLGRALYLLVLFNDYWWLDLLIEIIAVVFAILGLKSRLRWLSIITLCLEIIVISVLLFLFVFRRDLL